MQWHHAGIMVKISVNFGVEKSSSIAFKMEIE